MPNPRLPLPNSIEGRNFSSTSLRGGIDQEHDKFSVRAGTLEDALNYNSSTRGYQRAKGLLYYDGTADLAVSNMWVVAVNDAESSMVGTGFTLGGRATWGASSTGTVVYYKRTAASPDYTTLGLTELVGAAPATGDAITDVESGTVWTLGASLSYPPSELKDAKNPNTGSLITPTITSYLDYINNTVNYELVQQTGVKVGSTTTYHGPVPGLNAITGGWQFDDQVYVTRDGYSVMFSYGTDEIKAGEEVLVTLSDSTTEQAVVAAISLTSGTWTSGTAAGWMVLMPSASGTDYTKLANIKAPAGTILTVASSSTMAIVDSTDVQYGALAWKGTIHGWEWVDTGWTIEYNNGANAPNVKASPLFLADLISATRNTGATAAGAGTSVGSAPHVAWTGASNITAKDTSYATCALSSGESSQYLKAAIPASVLPQEDVRIVGIEAEVYGRYTGANAPIDTTVRLINTNAGASFYMSPNKASRAALLDYGSNIVSNGTFADGSNIVTNGTFGSDTEWYKGTGWTIASGTGRCDGTQSTDTDLYQDIPSIIPGEKYFVQFDEPAYLAGTVTPVLGGTVGTARSSATTHTEIITAGSNGKFAMRGDVDFNKGVDNISVVLIGDSGWTEGVGWEISGGNASCDGSQVTTSDLLSDGVPSAGEVYEVVFTVSGLSAGTITPVLGSTSGTARSANGTYTENITAGDDGTFLLRASNDFVGNVDSITVRAVSERKVYGSSTDTWGVDDISAADINSGLAGVVIQYSNETAGSGQAEVDYVSINVHYVPTTEKVWFNDGSADVATAVVHAFQIDGGDFGAANNAYGNMSLSNVSSPASIGAGVVMYSEPSAGGVVIGTVTAAPSYNLLPSAAEMAAESSKYLTYVFNYYENDSAKAVYGVTGASSSFTYDGDNFAFIRVPVARSADKPRHLAFHDNKLALGYAAGHVVLSSVGVPNNFSAVDSASTWGVGDRVTGLMSLAGNVLGVFSESSIRTLEGSSAATGNMRTLSSEQGAAEYTLQSIVGPYFANNSGVNSLPTTDKYGDFIPIKVSDPIRTWIQDRMQAKLTTQTLDTKPVMSVVVRSDNQYRLFFADGYILVLYFRTDGQVEPTIMHYDTDGYGVDYVPTFINSTVLSSGRERVVMGTSTGDVWIVDGANIIQHPDANKTPKCSIAINPINFGKPESLFKHYHAMVQGRFYGAQSVSAWASGNYLFDWSGSAQSSITFGDYSSSPIFDAQSELGSLYIPTLTDGFSLKIETTMDGSEPHTLQSIVFRASQKGADRNRASKTY